MKYARPAFSGDSTNCGIGITRIPRWGMNALVEHVTPALAVEVPGPATCPASHILIVRNLPCLSTSSLPLLPVPKQAPSSTPWLLHSCPRSQPSLFSLALRCCDAHQVVLLPAPTYTTDDKAIKYAPLVFLEDQGIATQEDFTAWREDNGYDSLRAFNDGASYTVSDGADFTCGFTNVNGDVQAIPDANAMRSTGYTPDGGPCEVWLDDTMVMQYDNCHESISGKDYTIDYSSCTSTCTLYWFWLGVRYLKNEYSWQIYKPCIPLSASARRLEGATNESAILDF